MTSKPTEGDTVGRSLGVALKAAQAVSGVQASVDTSKPAISGMAAETGGVLPRGLRGTQVGLDLRAPAAWPALEDMAMMQQAIQQGGDGRGVAE